MRERIQNILKGDETDVFAESALRPFWMLAKTRPALAEPVRTKTTIVDLAHARGGARGQGRVVRT